MNRDHARDTDGKATHTPSSASALANFGQHLALTEGLLRCPVIADSDDLAEAFESMCDLPRQVLVAGALDEELRLIHWRCVATGEWDRFDISVEEIFAVPLALKARGVVLLHNHLHSSLSPSVSDCQLTLAAHQLGARLGMPLHEHLIINGHGYRGVFDDTF